jgi:hypothetical protein
MISDNIRGLTNEINGKGVLVKPSIRSNELADLERARRSCWMQGFDLDFIEEIFLSCKPFEKESIGPCENLAVMWKIS